MNDFNALRFALRIDSGKIIFNRAMPERLRTLRHCIFTGGVVEENGSCRAAFCESAAQRGIKLPQSPTATAPSEMGPLAKPETFPPCQRLPPRGSWQNRQVLTEGVQPSPWGRWLDAKRQDGRGISASAVPLHDPIRENGVQKRPQAFLNPEI
ncbi:hypothetical protein C4N24_07425 [Faecalibacterium prausnitzii]|uniref:Uncharacterized protein n=1 Tax=Faecalibacterium prausnitzii TaxID=853 RepID=A0A329U4M7_9FIRM|nr:hypothetical protein C4N24_07425 [Faecalibacterium prausnitzii]